MLPVCLVKDCETVAVGVVFSYILGDMAGILML